MVPPVPSLYAQVRLALEMMFEGTQGTGDLGRVDAVAGQGGSGSGSGHAMLRIGDAVTLTYQPGAGSSGGHVVLEWCGGSDADMVADAVVAVVLGAAGQPPGMEGAEALRRKALAAGDTEGVERAELGILTSLLGAQFGPARVDADQVRQGLGSLKACWQWAHRRGAPVQPPAAGCDAAALWRACAPICAGGLIHLLLASFCSPGGASTHSGPCL